MDLKIKNKPKRDSPNTVTVSAIITEGKQSKLTTIKIIFKSNNKEQNTGNIFDSTNDIFINRSIERQIKNNPTNAIEYFNVRYLISE